MYAAAASSTSAPADLPPPTNTPQDAAPVSTGGGVFIANSTIVWPGGRSIGLGLFAGRDFARGEYITWYYGHRSRDVIDPAAPDPSQHKLLVSDGTVIDGTRTRDGAPITNPAVQLAQLDQGGAAWANMIGFPALPGAAAAEEPPGAVNNAAFVEVPLLDADARERHIIVFLRALTDIPRYSEIFVDYGLRTVMAPAMVQMPPAQASSSSGAPKRQKRKPAVTGRVLNPGDVPL